MNVLEPVESKIFHPIMFNMTEKNSRLIVESRNKKQDNKMDCVVNAMEILGLIDSFLAEAFRIVVKNGVTECDTEELFNALESHLGGNKQYKFGIVRGNSAIDFLVNFTKLMPNNTAIFTGTRKIVNGEDKGHVFVIAKDNHGVVQNIDLQNENRMCPLKDLQCFETQYGGGILERIVVLMTPTLLKDIPEPTKQLLFSTPIDYYRC